VDNPEDLQRLLTQPGETRTQSLLRSGCETVARSP